jgi:hypothetical protein
MCVQVTKTANRFEISSLLEKILLKQVRQNIDELRTAILQEWQQFPQERLSCLV